MPGRIRRNLQKIVAEAFPERMAADISRPLGAELAAAVFRNRSLIPLLLLAALGYSCFLYAFMSPYAAGADASGYLNFARLLTHGQVLAPVRELPAHAVTAFGEGTYQPQGFSVRNDSGVMSPTYPVGFPLHLTLATWLVGSMSGAVVIVNILAALAAGALLYASCRHLNLRPAWAAAATGALCLCPFFLNSTLQPMSDLLAMTWALAALYAAMRGRESILWTVTCGAAFGIAVLIRPTNTLLAFPILAGLGLQPLRLAGASLGALPAALFVLYLNFRLFGSPLTTGYGSPIQILQAIHADPTEPYSVVYVRHHLTQFVHWILLGVGPLALFALTLPFFQHGRTQNWAVHAIWVGVLSGFYAFYQPAGEAWFYVRFLLPCIPSLLMLTVGGLAGFWERLEAAYRTPIRSLPPFHRLRAESTTRKGIAIFALVILSVGWMVVATYRLSVLNLAEGERTYPVTAQWAIDHLPATALIWSSGMSGALYYYTQFPIVRFDFINRDGVSDFFRAATTAQRPMYAVLWPHEIDEMMSRIGGGWTKVAELRGSVTVLEFVR
jgi:hypothetical protein